MLWLIIRLLVAVVLFVIVGFILFLYMLGDDTLDG